MERMKDGRKDGRMEGRQEGRKEGRLDVIGLICFNFCLSISINFHQVLSITINFYQFLSFFAFPHVLLDIFPNICHVPPTDQSGG